jgi:hypothetical protein
MVLLVNSANLSCLSFPTVSQIGSSVVRICALHPRLPSSGCANETGWCCLECGGFAPTDTFFTLNLWSWVKFKLNKPWNLLRIFRLFHSNTPGSIMPLCARQWRSLSRIWRNHLWPGTLRVGPCLAFEHGVSHNRHALSRWNVWKTERRQRSFRLGCPPGLRWALLPV